jgi:hypothetical protein
MEDIRPYRIRNEENDRRNDQADTRVEWELTQRETAAEEDVPFHIPRD